MAHSMCGIHISKRVLFICVGVYIGCICIGVCTYAHTYIYKERGNRTKRIGACNVCLLSFDDLHSEERKSEKEREQGGARERETDREGGGGEREQERENARARVCARVCVNLCFCA